MGNYRHQDQFFKRGGEQGLPSRAAFKLSELLERYRLLRTHVRVLDLGCAPGGWLAVAARMAAADARIVGVDLVPCQPPSPKDAVLDGDASTPPSPRSTPDNLCLPPAPIPHP